MPARANDATKTICPPPAWATVWPESIRDTPARAIGGTPNHSSNARAGQRANATQIRNARAGHRNAVLEQSRGAGRLIPPTSPPSRLSSSAAGHRNHAPTEAGAEPTPTNGKSPSGPSGPAALASLSTPKLRSIVLRARQTHGPHRLRWENRERRAWDELCRRGMAA